MKEWKKYIPYIIGIGLGLLSMGIKAYIKQQHKQATAIQQTQKQQQSMEQLKEALKNVEGGDKKAVTAG